MITKKLLNHLDKFALTAIFVAASASTILWVVFDRTPPSWDPSSHINTAYDYFVPLARADYSRFYRDLFIESHHYAPIVHLITATVFLFSGASMVGAIVVNLISLAVLLISVYWIARMLYGSRTRDENLTGKIDASRWAGVMAALLAVSYHFSAWLLHDAFLDYPLIAIVAFSFALLIYAGDFHSTRRAIFFGAAAGLGLLTKQTFAFFFVLPSIYIAAKLIRTRKRRAILNLGLSAAVAIAIAAVWYLPHLDDVRAIYDINRAGAVLENEPSVFSFSSLKYYSFGLLNAQLQLPFALLFLYGLKCSFARFRKESLMLYLWIASGILMFTLIANKDVRYSVPILPAAALISTCWLTVPAKRGSETQQQNKKLFRRKPLLIAAIAILAVASFLNAQWPPAGSGLYFDLKVVSLRVFARNYYLFDHRPLSDDWGAPDAVMAIAGDWRDSQNDNNRERPIVGVVANLPFLNPSSVSLQARLLAVERAGPPLVSVSWLADEAALSGLSECDYLVARAGLENARWVASVERYIDEMARADPHRYTRLSAFALPSEYGEVVVYRINK